MTAPAEGEALQRLIKQWRYEADQTDKFPATSPGTQADRHATARTTRECADELEAALAPLAGPVDASGEPQNACGPSTVFEDTPLKAAIRKAFDYPSIANIEAVAAAAVPSSPAQPTDSEMFDALEIALYGKTGNTWEVGRMNKVRDVLRNIRAALPTSSPVADSDWIARVAGDIRALNPDYHGFEEEVAKLIRAAIDKA